MTRPELGASVAILDHAVRRYIERVRPGSEPARAHAELMQLLGVADFVFEAPEWLARRARQTAPVYAVIADVVLPLQVGRDRDSLVAVTCLTRGTLSEAARARRSAARLQRRARHGTGPTNRLIMETR
ncbi:MAG: hypothetical protein ACSLFR_13530 [Solirubrobacteraceae bacterium]